MTHTTSAPPVRTDVELDAWRATALAVGVDRAPRRLKARDVLLYRTLARRDAHRYGMPTRNAEGDVIAVSYWHLSRRAVEKEALLTERLAVDVAPIRSLMAACVAAMEHGTRAEQVALQAADALPEVDYAPAAGETATPEHIIRARRDGDRRRLLAGLDARAEHGRAEAAAAAALLMRADAALQERWELHCDNVRSWRSHRDRLGHVVTRAAMRRHPDPARAADLMREVASQDLELPAHHPWTIITTAREDS